MTEQSYMFRPSKRSDIAALNDIYLSLTGITRTVEQTEWEWWNGPYGPAPSWVIVDKESQLVVGHHGVIPVPLSVDGETVIGCRTENSMLLPQFRKKIPYHAIEAQLLEELSPQFPIIFTSAGKSAQFSVRKRLGYLPIARWQNAPVGATFSFLARRAAAHFLKLSAPNSNNPHPATDRFLTLMRSDSLIELNPSLDSFCEILSAEPFQDGIRLGVSQPYLNWRFDYYPYGRRHRMIFDGHTAVAFRLLPRALYAVDIEIELLASSKRHRIDALLQALSSRIVKLGATRVIYRHATGHPESADLSNPSSAFLLVRSSGVPQNWHAQQSITQGI